MVQATDSHKTINGKSDFVEKLTNDCFIVQVDRITNSYSTKLEKLLSLFEQQHFIDDKKITKEFNHKLDTEDIKLTADILHFSGTNPAERKKIEIEQEAWRTVNAIVQELRNTIGENKKIIDEKDKMIHELMRKLEEKK